MNRTLNAMATLMLMMVFAVGCYKPDEPNNGGNSNDSIVDHSGTLNDYDYVDLGLPSGTLWATCNVGASNPEDNGDYFTWDEGKTAAANWGNGWDMPSKEQWEELKENTKSTWTTRNGVNGRLFTSNNGNSLFLPAAGGRWNGNLYHAGSWGGYWSSTLYTGDPYRAWYFYFGSGYYGMSNSGRGNGFSVRPIRSSRQN